MNIINWIKSEYVTFIGNALLSFVWRVSPSKIEGRPPLCALTFRADSIAYLDKSGNPILFYPAPKNKYWKFQLPSSDMFAAALFHQGLSCQKSYPHSLDARGPRSKIVDI